MAQKQKATGIITLSALSIKFAAFFFAFCLKNIFSPFAIGLRTGTIYSTQTQTNKFHNFVRLFVIEMSST